MVTLTIGKHKVEIYDTIEALPVVRFHKFQKFLLIDSGLGADMTAFDTHIEKARRYIATKKNDLALAELENLRNTVYFIQSEVSPKHRAFAALVARIDGKPYDDLTDDGIDAVMRLLADGQTGEIDRGVASVKKKIDAELAVYFPSIFNTTEIREYYDLLKARTLAVLRAIVEGKHNPEGGEAERLTSALITYSHPKRFSGSDGVEIQFDRQFENLCLALSSQLNIDPKGCTVLEFYNAFDYLQQKAKEAKKAEKRRK